MDKKLLFRRMRKNKFFVVGVILTVLLLLVTFLAPLYVQFDPEKSSLAERLVGPDWGQCLKGHLFGTDAMGRDVFTRILVGGRYSLLIAFVVTALRVIIGTVLGLIAGYTSRKAVDSIIMRTCDIFLSLPSLIVALAIIAVMGANIRNLVIVLTLTDWMQFCRVIRNNVRVIRGQEYIKASTAFGASHAHALNGVNLTLRKGESLGLVGEAGAGKTTTALSILNLLPDRVGKHTGGDIIFDGKSVFSMSEKELLSIRGDRIAMIFQNPLTSLNPLFTVGEQIAMVLRKHKNMNPKQAMEKAAELLRLVGIDGSRTKDYPVQFSGGMRQRVGIAAALACDPELLIADEPTTALDVTVQAQILELMKKLQLEFSSSLLMITHNLGIISELCERVAVMYAGRIIETGSVKKVFTNPCHPYTVGLLDALPSLTDKKERLNVIPGLVANPSDLPTGCSFNPRCQHCTQQCKQAVPEMVQVDDDHFVACHKYSKEG